jgi:hypothetical protein
MVWHRWQAFTGDNCASRSRLSGFLFGHHLAESKRNFNLFNLGRARGVNLKKSCTKFLALS